MAIELASDNGYVFFFLQIYADFIQNFTHQLSPSRTEIYKFKLTALNELRIKYNESCLM